MEKTHLTSYISLPDLQIETMGVEQVEHSFATNIFWDVFLDILILYKVIN